MLEAGLFRQKLCMVRFLSVLLRSSSPVHYEWIMQATQMLHYHADWKIAYAQSSPTITKFQAGMCTKTFFLLLSMITVAK